MAYFSGQHGNLRFNTLGAGDLQGVVAIKDWNITFTQDVLDTTALGDTDKLITHGLRTFSGAFTIIYYSETAGADSNVRRVGQTLIKTNGLAALSPSNVLNPSYGGLADSPEPCQLQLKVIQGNDNRTIGVAAYITSFQVTCSTGEIVSANCTFQGTGAPSRFDY